MLLPKPPELSASLIISPPLSGKKEFLNNNIKNAIKENKAILLVLTDKNPEKLKKELLENKIFFKELYFVDCYSQQTGNTAENKENVIYVSGPLALNELSIAISEFEREFARKEIQHIIIFDSLSTLLMYSNAEAVARFLQILIAKIKNFKGNVIFLLEEGMHDEKAVVTIEHLMDSIINIKEDKDKLFIKAKGMAGFEEWTELK